MKDLKIALVQMKSEKGQIADNLKSIENYILRSKDQNAEIICFPEMSITGYVNPTINTGSILSVHSDPVKRVAQLSKIHQMLVIAGFIERNQDGKPFITQIAAQNGYILCLYRKNTIKGVELEWFSKGEATAVFSVSGIKFGLSICADINDENIFAKYALSGVKVVFECAAPGLYGEQASRDWQSGYNWWRSECMNKLGAYAMNHCIYIAVSTQAGRTVDEDFPGGGYVFSPEGQCIYETGNWSEGILYANITID